MVFSSYQESELMIHKWQDAGHKIVFTNGCFDILHYGHISYLEEARALGNKLIVGLNSDRSVRILKGPNRPIKDQKNRAYILSKLAMVDMVILFEEETPLNLIKDCKPDILVKGGDYTIDQIVGSDIVAQHGGVVKSLQFIPGYSSSDIIDKIKRS